MLKHFTTNYYVIYRLLKLALDLLLPLLCIVNYTDIFVRSFQTGNCVRHSNFRESSPFSRQQGSHAAVFADRGLRFWEQRDLRGKIVITNFAVKDLQKRMTYY